MVNDAPQRTRIVAVTHDPENLKEIMPDLTAAGIDVEVHTDTESGLLGRLYATGENKPDFFMTGLPFNINGMTKVSGAYQTSGYELPPIIVRTSRCLEDTEVDGTPIFCSPPTGAYEMLLERTKGEETTHQEHMSAWGLVTYMAFVVPKDAGAHGIARGIEAYRSRMSAPFFRSRHSRAL